LYPVTLGYQTAINRISLLMSNGHHAEALVTGMFTTEKTLRRTLRQIVVSAGFASKYADKIVSDLRGLDAIKKAWELYEPNNKKLTEILSPTDWELFKEGASMRNSMIHGGRVYKLDNCEKMAKEILAALDNVKKQFDSMYGYSGWETYQKRANTVCISIQR